MKWINRYAHCLLLSGIFLLDQLGLLCIATVIAVLSNKLHQYQDPNVDPMESFFKDKLSTKIYDLALENPRETLRHDEEDHFSQTPSDDASVDEDVACRCTQEFEQFRPTQDESEIPHQPVDRFSWSYSSQNMRLANSQHESPIFQPRQIALPVNFMGDRQRNQQIPARIVHENFVTLRNKSDDGFFRKLYKLGRKLFQPRSTDLRRDVAAGIDNMGILVYLFATFMNAVFCLIIMPGRER